MHSVKGFVKIWKIGVYCWEDLTVICWQTFSCFKSIAKGNKYSSLLKIKRKIVGTYVAEKTNKQNNKTKQNRCKARIWQADCSKIQKSFLNHSIFVLKTIQCIFQTIQCNAQFNSIVHSIQCIFNSMLHSIQCIFNSMPTSMPHSIQFNDEKCSTHALRKKITDQVCSDVIGSEAKMPARTELEEGVMAALLWW